MPIPVAAWVDSTFPTAKSLNLAMYTADGTGSNPTGVSFLAYRPLLFESYSTAGTIHANAAGSQSSLSGVTASGTATVSTVWYDTSGYYGLYADQPGAAGSYQFTPAVKGSAGDGSTVGGWTVLAHFAAIAHKATQTSVSADLLGTDQTPVAGTRQAPSASLDSTAWFCDLVNVGGGITWSPAVTVADSGSNSTTLAVNTTDSSGETCRFTSVWAAVSATTSGQAVYSQGGEFPFTAPVGVTEITSVNTGSGAGGGMGSTSAATYGGGGGGGGQTSIGAVSVTPMNDYTVQVGIGGQPGEPGNPSVFVGDVASVTAEGGAAGGNATGSADGAAGAGGTGGTGATRYSGGSGAAGSTNSYGGGGGSSAGTGQAGTNAMSSAGAPSPTGGGPGGAGGVETITVVQQQHFTGTGANTITCTMPAAFQAGNTVLVMVYYQGDFPSQGTTPDPTVVLSDGVTTLTQQENADVGSNDTLQIGLFDTYAITGGQTGFTVTAQGTNNSVKAFLIECYEVNGLGPSPTIDPASSSHTQGPHAPTINYQSYSGSPGTTATAPQLWVAMTTGQQTDSFNFANNPPHSQGWTLGTPRYVNNGGVYAGQLSAYQVVTKTGVLQFTGTFSKGVTKGTFAVGYQASPDTTGSAPPIGPGGGGGGGLGTGNEGGAGFDGQVILTWTAPSGSGYGTPSLPAPYSAWADSTTVGTTGLVDVNLNSSVGPGGVLNFLSNPPCFRISQQAPTAIPSGTVTAVTFTGSTPVVDSYSGWSTASAAYAVQRTGLYLAHGLAAFGTASAGVRMAAFAVTASGSASATYYWGPPAAGAAVNGTHVAKTHILGLAAGDQIGFAAYQTSGSTLDLSAASQTRFLLAWVAETGLPAGTWSPPDATFRWSSGTKPTSDGGNLTGLFQAHLGNDLGFLANRPYFTGYQNIAQSGLPANTYTTLSLNQVQGYIHAADNGDNYAGWSSGSNTYTAQAAGWYLFCCEAFTSAPTTAGCTVIAAALIASSGGVTPSQSPDAYQQNVAPQTFGGGAAALGVVYLDVGETIAFQVQGAGYTASYQTIVGLRSGGFANSHAEMVWISE